jgi:glyoxylase I family protein
MSSCLDPNTIHRLHHFAYRCRDASETTAFYEGLLGLPLVNVVKSDYVPSVGESQKFAHIFFEMRDGSHLAFFDLGDDVASEPSPNTPKWVNHIALEVDTMEEVEEAKRRLEKAGIEVLGVTDHGFINSIYFFDPNGVRLELTVRTGSDEFHDQAKRDAHQRLSDWTSEKQGTAVHA